MAPTPRRGVPTPPGRYAPRPVRPATSRIVLATALAVGAGLVPAGPAPAATGPMSYADEGVRPAGTPFRVNLYPVRLPGQRMPTRARLDRAFAQTAALLARTSQGRIRLRVAFAPTFTATRRMLMADGSLHPRHYTDARRAAAAAGFTTGGGLPVVVVPSRQALPSFGGTSGVAILGTHWANPRVIGHEIGHGMGLLHSEAPTVCRGRFTPVGCVSRPRTLNGYADPFDLMSRGDRLGGYSWLALGLGLPTDALARAGRVRLAPMDGPSPTVLRLRAAGHDWIVDTRRRYVDTYEGATGVPGGVAIARVAPRYEPLPDADTVAAPRRVASRNPAVACTGLRACTARWVFRPGRTFTVPGTFRLRVLPMARRGVARVAVTWLDRTPPQVTVRSALIVRRADGRAELQLRLTTSATGAGIATVEVDQGGAVTRVPAGGVAVVPLAPGAVTARVRVIDAAGNASAPRDVDLGAVPSRAGAVVAMNPAPGSSRVRLTQVAAGPVTITGRTSPEFAGLLVDLAVPGLAPQALTIAADGSFTGSVTAIPTGEFQVTARVPVGRRADGITLEHEEAVGHYRG